jgi:hypothetical protein
MKSSNYGRPRRNCIGTFGTCRCRADAAQNVMGQAALKTEWRLPSRLPSFGMANHA